MAEADLLYPEQVWDALEAIAVQNDVAHYNRENLIRKGDT